MTTEGMGPADIAAITGNGNNGNGGMWDNGAWWIIILFLFAGWGGRGYGGGFGGSSGGGGAADNYVLTSDFAQIERKLDSITNGQCNGFYTQAQLINGTNTALMQGFNASQAQMAQCCCDIREGISGVNYNMAMNANGITNAVNTGFCQTNFNNQNNTRDLLENQNANTRAILDALNANKVEALKERIAEQNQQINYLTLTASQQSQNNVILSGQQASEQRILDKLSPCPIPAYLTCNPNAPINYSVQYGNGCGGCGCGNY